jgi:hypothetical protein
MDKFINAIMANLPVILLIIPLYILVKKLSDSFGTFVNMYMKTTALKRTNTGAQVPNNIKIAACERLILFLERISPESLITRLNTIKYTNREFQLLLIEEVRKEFTHNLTQQLYVSEMTWQACENAKNDIISIINAAAAQAKTKGDSIEISNQILQLYMLNNKGIYTAKNLLKRELV